MTAPQPARTYNQDHIARKHTPGKRRVRVLDLPEEEKEGLILLVVKISECMRFEKPKVYIEQIQLCQLQLKTSHYRSLAGRVTKGLAMAALTFFGTSKSIAHSALRR